MGLLEELHVPLVIVRGGLGQVLEVPQLLRRPAQTLPVDLRDDAGDEILIELYLADLDIPGLDGEGVARGKTVVGKRVTDRVNESMHDNGGCKAAPGFARVC